MNKISKQFGFVAYGRPCMVRTLVGAAYAVMFALMTNPAVAADLNQPVAAQDVSGKAAVESADEQPESDTVGPERPPTIKEILLEACRARGYDEDCAKTLLGMAWKESRFISTAVGDQGRAQGWFQIHTRLHRVALSCAQDLNCAADWTISYMESNGYPKYVRYAVQCHNGCNVANGYAASALRHGVRLWDEMPAVADKGETQQSQILALRQ